MISIDQIKKLREETGFSIIQCKKALEETKGNFELAKEILRKWGEEFSEKKEREETKEGVISTYLHSNKKIGVLVDLRCQSDFVAKSETFQKLAHELCLQIAAMNPLFLKKEDISEEFLKGERKIYLEQLRDSGKPKKLIEEIVEGKIEKCKEEISLLSQTWIKDESKKISDLIDEYIAKFGENIIIKRFARFEI